MTDIEVFSKLLFDCIQRLYAKLTWDTIYSSRFNVCIYLGDL